MAKYPVLTVCILGLILIATVYWFETNSDPWTEAVVMAYDANCSICGTGDTTASGEDASFLGVASLRLLMGRRVNISGVGPLIFDDVSPTSERRANDRVMGRKELWLEVRLMSHDRARQWGVKRMKIRYSGDVMYIE